MAALHEQIERLISPRACEAALEARIIVVVARAAPAAVEHLHTGAHHAVAIELGARVEEQAEHGPIGDDADVPRVDRALGATAEGIDDLLIGQDGVGVLDVRVFGSLPDGTVVAWTVKGFAGDAATIRSARFGPSRCLRRTAHPRQQSIEIASRRSVAVHGRLEGREALRNPLDLVERHPRRKIEHEPDGIARRRRMNHVIVEAQVRTPMGLPKGAHQRRLPALARAMQEDDGGVLEGLREAGFDDSRDEIVIWHVG